MTEDCPGYDRDRRMCLLRPDDCEFAPVNGEAVLMVATPDVLTTRRAVRQPVGTRSQSRAAARERSER